MSISIGKDTWYFQQIKYDGFCEICHQQMKAYGDSVFITKRNKWFLRCVECMDNIINRPSQGRNHTTEFHQSTMATSSEPRYHENRHNGEENVELNGNDDDDEDEDEDDVNDDEESNDMDDWSEENYEIEDDDDDDDDEDEDSDDESVDSDGNLKGFIEEDTENIEEIFDREIEEDESTNCESSGYDDDNDDDNDDDEGHEDNEENIEANVIASDEEEVMEIIARYKYFCYKCNKKVNRDSFSDAMKRRYKDSRHKCKIYCLKHTSTSCFNQSYKRPPPVNLRAIISQEQEELARSNRRKARRKKLRLRNITHATADHSSHNLVPSSQSSDKADEIANSPIVTHSSARVLRSSHTSSSSNRTTQESSFMTPSPSQSSTRSFTQSSSQMIYSPSELASKRPRWYEDDEEILKSLPRTRAKILEEQVTTPDVVRKYTTRSSAAIPPPLPTIFPVYDEDEEIFEYEPPRTSSHETTNDTNTQITPLSTSAVQGNVDTPAHTLNHSQFYVVDDDSDSVVYTPSGKKLRLSVGSAKLNKPRRIEYDDDD